MCICYCEAGWHIIENKPQKLFFTHSLGSDETCEGHYVSDYIVLIDEKSVTNS